MKKILLFFLVFSLFFISGCGKVSEVSTTLVSWDVSNKVELSDLNQYEKYILWFNVKILDKLEKEYDTLEMNIIYTLEDNSKINSSVKYSGYFFDDSDSIFLGVVYVNDNLERFADLGSIKSVTTDVTFSNSDAWDLDNKLINPSFVYSQLYLMSDDFGDAYYAINNDNYTDMNIALIKNKDYEYNIASLLEVSPNNKEILYGDIFYQENENNVENIYLIPCVLGNLY